MKRIVTVLVLLLGQVMPIFSAWAGVWSKPATVKNIFPRIYALGGNSYPSLEFNTNGNPLNDDGSAQGTSCGESTRVVLRGTDGASYDLQMQSLKSMESGLMMALTSGLKI